MMDTMETMNVSPANKRAGVNINYQTNNGSSVGAGGGQQSIGDQQNCSSAQGLGQQSVSGGPQSQPINSMVGQQMGANQSPGSQSTAGQPTYSIPGIVHYLQYEWQRFEMQRQQWEVERAELQARIALLQGERKGQENLKNDLVRRIKMLEYCLRQERAKYHKLKFGCDPPNMGANNDELKELNSDLEESLMSESGGQTAVNWKQGRQLLRQYLQEIGYTDTIIDVRSNRVRSLLGLTTNTSLEEPQTGGQDSTDTSIRKLNDSKSKYEQRVAKVNLDAGANWRPNNAMVTDTEASVLATFEFLNEQREGQTQEDVDEEEEDEESEEIDTNRSAGPYAIDSETEEVLAEFDFLSTHPSGEQKDGTPWGRPGSGKDVVDIGELAALTVANESLDLNGSTANSSMNTEFRKTWNPKYILKSHFDCVRCLRFHATEPLLITCSEDETLKLWNLNKTQQSNKGKQQQPTGPTAGTTFDLEPVYTYRGHTSRVLSLAVNNNTIYSGAQSGQLMIWSIPANIANIDPYDAYDTSLQLCQMDAHTNAIWSLVTIPSTTTSPLLCSAAADQTIKIWDTSRVHCLKTISLEGTIRPTSLAAIAPHNNNSENTSPSLLAAAFTDGSISVYDMEATTQSTPVLTFEAGAPGRVNAIAVHPTMPVLVSAHEDRQIKLWDLNSGKCLHAMVAHLDEVTCLACDPNGLYLLSASHDCSVRLWNFDSRTCVQEITSHRKKFDEAIFDVTFHPSRPYFASAGADALAKVFV